MKSEKKEWALVVSALVTLASGICLSFFSFFLTIEHEVTSSVLFYFGQCLIYAASAFGLTAYVKAKLKEFEHEIKP